MVLSQPRGISAGQPKSVGDMDNISSFNFEDFDPFALPFVMASDKSKLPTCPGIYFAIGGPRTIVYIGSARNIRARWKNHHVYIFLAMAMVDARIAYMTANSEGRLRIFEEALIKHFSPVLNVASNGKTKRLNVLDALDRLNKMDELYSKEATVDRVSTAYLLKRYNLNSRTALINRLGALEIKPVREGNRFFVSVDEMDRLDALNECLKQGNSLTECAIEVKAGSFSKSMDRIQNDPLPTVETAIAYSQPSVSTTLLRLPDELIYLLQRFLEQRPNSWDNYKQLEEIVSNSWVISTSKLLPLLGRKSIPKLDDHNRFSSHGFTFWKSGKMGNEYGWRVTKQQL